MKCYIEWFREKLMSLSILIVDDEPLAHKVISNYCQTLDFIEVKGKCYTAFEAINYLNENEVDLIFWILICLS